MKSMNKKIRKNSERGQAIILVAFAIVGLVAIVGLMIDGGMLLIEYARLKRGIDAASIASASQFRKGFSRDDLVKAGQEFLKFNQSDAAVEIHICRDPVTNVIDDPSLCFNPPRKLVRITATRHVDFGFMRIVGIMGTNIKATSVGEAAAIDMVLAIDTSSSMAYDTTVGGTDSSDPADPTAIPPTPGDDPEVCNANMNDPSKRCEPLGTIKDVAINFVEDQLLFYPYDQVAIVASASQTPGGDRNPVLVLPFNNNYNEATNTDTTEIQTAIRSLKVFQPVRCSDPAAASSEGGCLVFEPEFRGVSCVRADPNDPSTCGSSNMGGMLYMAGRQFSVARQESFWVAIGLIGGPATATDPLPGRPNGFCPSTTWNGLGRGCRDFDTVSYNNGFSLAAPYNYNDPAKRHYQITTTTPVTFPANYDTDDYARDGADYVTSRTIGQGATLYSICLGSLCRGTDLNKADPASGEHLAKYMAEYSGGADANHGLYYFSNNVLGLSAIFSSIANNIFTRISQ
jgi:hypothetical protein